MRRHLSLTILLVLIWLCLSGAFSLKPLIAVFGVCSIAFVVWFFSRLLREAEAAPIHGELLAIVPRLPRFLLHLSWLVIQSNLRVTQLLLDPRVDTDPRILRMKVGPRTDLGRFLLANSITLTPGTVTLDLRGGEILVHALGSFSAASVSSGEIDRAVRRVEGSLAKDDRDEGGD